MVPTSWPNLMRDFADDRFDIAMSGISINLERQRQAYFSRDGKTPITLCSEEARFQTLEQIDQPGVTAIVNPGGTNEKFARANLKKARILVHPDNVTIFQQIVDGKADLMMTDAIEARLQSRLHPELCAVHPQQPFDFAEKAYLLPRDEAFKRYVDQWLHIAEQSGLLRQRMEHWLGIPLAHRARQVVQGRRGWPRARAAFLAAAKTLWSAPHPGAWSMRYLLFVTVLWAFSFNLIGEYLAGQVDSYFAVLTRVLLAGLVFLPLTRWRGVEPRFVGG